jgi:hypothetical protein
MEIAATPATVPPAMAPVFELCPPTPYPTGPGVDETPIVYGGREVVTVVLGTGLVGELIVLGPVEEPAGPSIAPGPNSGLSTGSKTGVRGNPGNGGDGGREGRNSYHQRHSHWRNSKCPQTGTYCEC